MTMTEEMIEQDREAEFLKLSPGSISRLKHRRLMDILSTVASYYGFAIADLTGPRRYASLARARQVSMYLMRTTTGVSLDMIGKVHGGRDHTTTLHGVRVIDTQRMRDEELAGQVKSIVAVLSQPSPVLGATVVHAGMGAGDRSPLLTSAATCGKITSSRREPSCQEHP